MNDGASFCLKDKFELSEKVLLDIKQVRASWIEFFCAAGTCVMCACSRNKNIYNILVER